MRRVTSLFAIALALAAPWAGATDWQPVASIRTAALPTLPAGSEGEAQVADALRLPPWDAVVGVLSGGEKRRVALCRLLLSKPDMLLLDEPTNHLDSDSIAWLKDFLSKHEGGLIMISHDVELIEAVCNRVWFLDAVRADIDASVLRAIEITEQ